MIELSTVNCCVEYVEQYISYRCEPFPALILLSPKTLSIIREDSGSPLYFPSAQKFLLKSPEFLDTIRIEDVPYLKDSKFA